MIVLAALRSGLLALGLLVLAGSAHADSYEAKLPPELTGSPKLCDYAPCQEVLPGATRFSERKGQPPYVEGYKEENGQSKLVGYVMLSTDITDIPAYSGKPVVTLIGMDATGHFVGVKILKHSMLAVSRYSSGISAPDCHSGWIWLPKTTSIDPIDDWCIDGSRTPSAITKNSTFDSFLRTTARPSLSRKVGDSSIHITRMYAETHTASSNITELGCTYCGARMCQKFHHRPRSTNSDTPASV